MNDCPTCDGRTHSSGSCSKCKKNIQRLVRRIITHYLGCQCTRCGESDPRCLHMHHIDRENKGFTIGSDQLEITPELIVEADKCELLCMVCHHKEHLPDLKSSVDYFRRN